MKNLVLCLAMLFGFGGGIFGTPQVVSAQQQGYVAPGNGHSAWYTYALAFSETDTMRGYCETAYIDMCAVTRDQAYSYKMQTISVIAEVRLRIEYMPAGTAKTKATSDCNKIEASMIAHSFFTNLNQAWSDAIDKMASANNYWNWANAVANNTQGCLDDMKTAYDRFKEARSMFLDNDTQWSIKASQLIGDRTDATTLRDSLPDPMEPI